MLLGPQDIVWSIVQAGDYNSRVQQLLKYFITFDCSVEYHQGHAFSLSHSPETAKEQDDRGFTSLIPYVADGGIYQLGLRPSRSLSTDPSCWLGRAGAHPDGAGFG